MVSCSHYYCQLQSSFTGIVISSAGASPITMILNVLQELWTKTILQINHKSFSGWMDELRIWDIGLSPDHIRQMMNQQIIDNMEPLEEKLNFYPDQILIKMVSMTNH
jgi:hypothetical protein